MTRSAAAVVTVVLLAAAAVPAGAVATGAQTGDASAYAGTHVAFDVQSDAVVDYAVEGDAVLDSVRVQSGSSGEAGGVFDGSVDLAALVRVDGAALSVDAETNAAAEVGAEGSASMTAHDDEHGILVVRAGGSDQVVVANLSSGTSASAASDDQVEVTTEDGTRGTFIVVGDGEVAVNDDGDVSAKLSGDARLVFRAYPDGKSERAEQTEAYIADGTATAEVYVDQQDGETVTDTVTYGRQTSVSAEQSAEETVAVTVDRAASTGKIVVTSVSEAAVGSVSDLSVTVDGEAAARASSYGDLESAIGGDQSKFLAKQSASASARADVYVAVSHFSARPVRLSGDDATSEDGGGDGGDDGGDGSTGGGAPGFGVGVALAGALGAALVALRA